MGHPYYAAPLLVAALACGGEADVITDPDPDPTAGETSELAGTVIAADSFDVVPVAVADIADPEFLVVREHKGGFPHTRNTAAGKVLVLSVRDLSRPEAVCSNATFSEECASMVVLERSEGIGRRPGRISLSLTSGSLVLFPQLGSALANIPPPG